MNDLWALIPEGALLFLPGYVLTRIIPRSDMEPFQRAIIATTLGMALAPLLLLWSTLAGLRWGGPTAWMLIVISALVFVWTWRGRGAGRFDARSWIRANAHFLLLALVFSASLAVSLLAVRNLTIPSWGDTIHHSWIARLIAERGQVPDSYYPYFPLDSMTYHYGYHAMVAFFSWVSGLSIIQSMLIFGQLLNALSVATIYLLTHRLTRSHTAAIISALIGGLISMMPSYYVNWGRYTQLAGQVILPVAVFLTIEAIERRHWGYLALAAVSTSGLFLTHYRVILFYVAFMAAFLAWRLWRKPGLKASLEKVGWLAGTGTAALALVAPRIWYLAINLPRAEASVPQLSPEAWDQWMTGYNALGDVTFYVSWPLLILTALAFLLATRKRQGLAAILGIWVTLLFTMANAERLGLGRGAWLNNFAVLIALYLPVSILVGWLGGLVLPIVRHASSAAYYSMVCLVVAAGIWGSWGVVNTIDQGYVLATPTDQRAIAWIKTNTPPSARFLINSFFAYGDRFVVGSDGGWWIPFLTGREVNIPPLLYGAESSPEKDYAAKANALARSLQASPYTKEGALLMKEEGISYIFVGEKGGYLDPSKLLAAGHQAVYHDGPDWIFKVNYSGSGT
ncbi:MAG: glycosyltransferase family 39 protein [Dehalococcoidia bacterium]|nr:glycosyltransferase family 39 protein [Dehalococcoidia bacterium]